MANLKLGDIVEGHVYMGGVPNDKASWVNPDELASTGKTGDDFLGLIQQSHPSLVPIIKRLSSGDQAVPSNRALVDPYWGTIFNLAGQYDPTLSAVDYPKRQKVAKDFASGGAEASNIRNLNQAIGHLHGLTQDYGDVSGAGGLLGLGRLWNVVDNKFKDWNGEPGITDYEAHRKALAGELASVFKGKGTSAEQEVNKWYDQLNPNLSTSQKNANARAIVDLLNSRLDELSQQYNDGMKKTPKSGFDFLNPQTKPMFEKLQTLGLDPDKAKMVQDAESTGGEDPATAALMKKYNIPATP